MIRKQNMKTLFVQTGLQYLFRWHKQPASQRIELLRQGRYRQKITVIPYE